MRSCTSFIRIKGDVALQLLVTKSRIDQEGSVVKVSRIILHVVCQAVLEKKVETKR